MMYLLDTDILNNLMKRAPASALVTRLAGVELLLAIGHQIFGHTP